MVEPQKLFAANIVAQAGATIAELALMPFTIVDNALAEESAKWEEGVWRPGPIFGNTSLRNNTVWELTQRAMNPSWSHWWHLATGSGSH